MKKKPIRMCVNDTPDQSGEELQRIQRKHVYAICGWGRGQRVYFSKENKAGSHDYKPL